MEEKLLTSKIINIEDIKNLSQLDDPNYEAERCEEILSHMLNLPSLAMFRHISEEVPDDIIRPQKDPLQRYYRINQAMTLLADFAMLDRKVYFAQDSRSLINLKWQKSLLGDKEAD